jgi:hypothetical protein
MTLPPKELKRLKKILARTQSPSEAEALNAANQATKLLARYNLSLSDISIDEPVGEDYVGQPRSAQQSKWRRILLSSIADSSDCQAVSQRVRTAEGYRYVTGVVGSAVGRQVVAQLFEYLEQAIEQLAEESIADMKRYGYQLPTSYRQNFSEGAAVRLAIRLNREADRRRSEGLTFEDSTHADAGAIVLVHQSAMEAIDRFCDGAGYPSAPAFKVDPARSGFVQGHVAAGTIGLSPQIEDGQQNSTKLLDGGSQDD